MREFDWVVGECVRADRDVVVVVCRERDLVRGRRADIFFFDVFCGCLIVC